MAWVVSIFTKSGRGSSLVEALLLMTSERLHSSVIFTSSYMSSSVCKFFAIMELLALLVALVGPGDGGVDAGDGIVGGVLVEVEVDGVVEFELD